MSLNRKPLFFSVAQSLVVLFAIMPIVGGSGWIRQLYAAPMPAPTDDPPAELGLMETQELVHTGLFSNYSPENFMLSLDGEAIEEGTMSGTNYMNEPFQLEIVLAVPLDIVDTLAQTAESLAAAEELDLTITAVVSVITTQNGSFAITGQVHSALVDGSRINKLLILTKEDPSSAIFHPLVPEEPTPPSTDFQDTDELDPAEVFSLNEIGYHGSPVLPPNFSPLSECLAVYNADIQAANDAYNATQQAAIDTYNAARTASINQYNDDVQSAKWWLAAKLATCEGVLLTAIGACAAGAAAAVTTPAGWLGLLFTGGTALALCLTGAHLLAAGCTTWGIHSFNQDMAAANTAHQTRLALALAVQTATMLAAANTKSDAKTAAQLKYLECVENAGGVGGGPILLPRDPSHPRSME